MESMFVGIIMAEQADISIGICLSHMVCQHVQARGDCALRGQRHKKLWLLMLSWVLRLQVLAMLQVQWQPVQRLGLRLSSQGQKTARAVHAPVELLCAWWQFCAHRACNRARSCLNSVTGRHRHEQSAGKGAQVAKQIKQQALPQPCATCAHAYPHACARPVAASAPSLASPARRPLPRERLHHTCNRLCQRHAPPWRQTFPWQCIPHRSPPHTGAVASCRHRRRTARRAAGGRNSARTRASRS